MSVPVVYDCMLFLMHAARPGRVRETFQLVEEGAVVYCLSPAILAEIEDVLTRPLHRRRFPQLTPSHVSAFLADITARSRLLNEAPEQYVLLRDPKDSKYINLALAAGAKYLVSRDKDLLSLQDPTTAEGGEFQRMFPQLRIIEPALFVQEMRQAPGMPVPDAT